MWIFTEIGYFSVVKKSCQDDEVIVRARVREDLVRLKIRADSGTDYRFRAVIKKAHLAEYLQQAVLTLNYDNFKDTVPHKDSARKSAYLRCWEALCAWQERIRAFKR
jgi:hypothetical protein